MVIEILDTVFAAIAFTSAVIAWRFALRTRRACPGCARLRATRAELVDTLEHISDDTQPSAEYGPWRA